MPIILKAQSFTEFPLALDLAKAVAIMPVILFELDSSGKILWIAGHDLEKLGLDQATLIGQLAHKSDNVPVTRSFFKRAKSTTEPIVFTYPISALNLIYETTLIGQAPAIDAEPVILGMSLDITKRMALEQEMDEDSHHMQATQRLSSLAGIANGLAHEINNPLQIVSGYCQLIRSGLEEGKEVTKKLIHAADRAVAACDRTHVIIERIQTFSRATSFDVFEPADLKAVLNGCLELFETRFHADNIELQVQVDCPSDVYPCRPVDISQAVYYLVENSLESLAGQEGGKITISLTELANGYEFIVADNGPGFTPRTKTKAFEPFFTTKNVGDGTGLGLSTAKGLVEGHQGKIAIIDDQSGAIVKIFLPKLTKPEQVAS